MWWGTSDLVQNQDSTNVGTANHHKRMTINNILILRRQLALRSWFGGLKQVNGLMINC